MTKSKKVLSQIEGQMSIFESITEAAALTRQTEEGGEPGALYILASVKAAIKDDIKHAVDERGRTLSRPQVAERMSRQLNVSIMDSTLYNWTCMEHPHIMRVDYLPAFVIATGGQRRTFEVLSNKAGLYALPGKDALRAEIRQIDETIQRLHKEKRRRILYLGDTNQHGE
jgi:hypothetical protein